MRILFNILNATCVCIAFSSVISAGEASTRLPRPSQTKSAEKIKLLKEVLADEYRDTTPDGRSKLLTALLAQSLALNDDPESKYFALQEARDIAIQLGRVPVVINTCDLLAADFDFDVIDEKGQSLGKVSDSSKSKDVHLAVAQAGLALLEDVSTNATSGNIKNLASATERASMRAGDSALSTKVKAQIKAAEASIIEIAGLEKAREKLTTAPEDSAANLSLGKYNCFVKGDWEAGLKQLILGSDVELKEIAKKDLAALDLASRVSAGDAWWALSEKQSGPTSAKIKRRAADHYNAAFPELSGLTKTKIEKRLASLSAAGIEPPQKTPSVATPTSPTSSISPISLTGKSVVRTKRAGGKGGTDFEDICDGPGMLVGLRVGKSNYVTSTIVGAVQGIYQVGSTVKRGKAFGAAQRDMTEVIAKPGYAVGGLKHRSGDRIDSMKLVFMKITNTGLDPNDSYESDWFGGSGPPEEYSIDGGGKPIVGIHGGSGKDLEGFGLVALASKAPPLKLKSGTPEQSQIFACCDDKAEIYINGRSVMNVGFEQVGTANVALSIGDVICVKVTDIGGGYAFACAIKASQGQFIRTNAIEWKTYAPKDLAKWWELPAKPVLINTQKGTSPATVTRVADQATCPSDFDQIWPLGINGNATGYLYYIIQENSFKP